MKRAADFRLEGREALRGKWGISILVSLVASLLSGAASAGSSAFNAANNEMGTTADTGVLESLIDSPVGRMVMIVMGAFAVVAVVYGIVCFLIGGAIELGRSRYYLTLARGGQGQFGQLFSGFNQLGKALTMVIVRNVLVFLGCLLLVFPGILLAYGFSIAPYILVDDPQCGPVEALKRSYRMMRGNRWRKFCLEMSFIGWMLLASLTCGIGVLWLNPYVSAADAAFYPDVSAQAGAQDEAQAVYE